MLYKETDLPSGSLFDGVVLTTGDVFMIADDDTTSIRKRRSELNPTLESEFLEIVKNIHIKQSISKDFNEELKSCFEYPNSSGNTFPIYQSKISEYNSLALFSSSFSYSMEYKGNGSSSVTFTSAADVDAFVAAALSAYQIRYKNKFIAAIDAVRSVTITTTLEQALIDIFAISY